MLPSMWSRPDFFDAHVLADALSDADLETLVRLGISGVLVCANDGASERRHEVTADAWLRHFDDLLTVQAERLRKHGLRAFFAIGVHAAHAPWHGLERLLHRLPSYLSHPAVVAVGAIGCRSLEVRERHVLSRQFEIAAELRRPVVVSMPPNADDSQSRAFLRLLREQPMDPERVLVEGAPLEALRPARAMGFHVALDASSRRMTMADVVSLVRLHGPNGFVLSSHAGEGAADLLAVPGMAAGLADAGLPSPVIRRVARDNALRFLRRTMDDAGSSA